MIDRQIIEDSIQTKYTKNSIRIVQNNEKKKYPKQTVE